MQELFCVQHFLVNERMRMDKMMLMMEVEREDEKWREMEERWMEQTDREQKQR